MLYPGLSRPFPNEDIVGGGLVLLTRNSTRFSISMYPLSGVVNSILGDNCTSLQSRGDTHSSGTSPSPHQAVTCSLSSPFYNDVIHLTGVYIFPNEGKLEEFFHTLTAHSNHTSHEPHIYAGDFKVGFGIFDFCTHSRRLISKNRFPHPISVADAICGTRFDLRDSKRRALEN